MAPRSTPNRQRWQTPTTHQSHLFSASFDAINRPIQTFCHTTTTRLATPMTPDHPFAHSTRRARTLAVSPNCTTLESPRRRTVDTQQTCRFRHGKIAHTSIPRPSNSPTKSTATERSDDTGGESTATPPPPAGCADETSAALTAPCSSSAAHKPAGR